METYVICFQKNEYTGKGLGMDNEDMGCLPSIYQRNIQVAKSLEHWLSLKSIGAAARSSAT
jgi:hypothetical protein